MVVLSHMSAYSERMFLMWKAGVSALRWTRCAVPSDRMSPKPMMRARNSRTRHGFSKSYVLVLMMSSRAWWLVASR